MPLAAVTVVVTLGLVDVGDKGFAGGLAFSVKPYGSEQRADMLCELIDGSQL